MKLRLSLLYFLQFSVWGCYLVSFGQFLGAGGLGNKIAWFYAAIGLVSILTPPLSGRLADKTGRPETLLGISHLLAAGVMFLLWYYGQTHPHLDFKILYPLYLLFLGLYMPTMALANTTAFGLLTQSGHNTVTSFPSIRVWGTVGFVVAMWFVNSAYLTPSGLGFTLSDSGETGHLRFQYNAMQLLCSAVAGVLTSLWAFSLPRVKMNSNKEKDELAEKSRIGVVKSMFRTRGMGLFLIFVVFSGVCLQISNGFVTPFITHFIGESEYANSFASDNATMLFSLSQISEALCILLVGITLKSKGIKFVYALGLMSWALRFFLLGAGNPGGGLWMLVGSMLVYGPAFNFITIAGHIYIQQIAPVGMKGFAQGIMMFMSNGIGATVGMLVAGVVINRWCEWQTVTVNGVGLRLFMGEWIYPWLIFGAYALVISILWLIFYRKRRFTQSPN